ncbi:ComEA family DNA-binding protein [Campylobacter mucosalis]|uniref:ComEA family DNA-binding protein n=1 Tax=Campylobacter mucosalis TaxID=202 RepID=UPI00146FFDD0|nr:helix-hairpin-helix domain-containing protein [Campylobacter mucosalis]
MRIFISLVFLSIFAFGLTDLNKASSSELIGLGLSKTEALNIIKYRKVHKFKSTDELFKVKGLSGQKALKIRDKVKVTTKKQTTRKEKK